MCGRSLKAHSEAYSIKIKLHLDGVLAQEFEMDCAVSPWKEVLNHEAIF